jgi:fumarate hydratase class II
VRALQQAITAKAAQWQDVVKIGRTHLEDAVPLTVGQEWSGWAAHVGTAAPRVETAQGELYRLAAGGTAVGTGLKLNAPHNFGADIAAEIAELTGKPFVTAPNKFEVQGGLDGIVAAGAATG